MTDVLARRDRALNPEETAGLLREHLGDGVLESVTEFGVFTLWIAPESWTQAARHCRDERLLAYDLFDCLFGVDAREDGFDVVAVLYSTSTGNRIALRTRCEGGREAPSCPSLTDVYRGADWMERETWDMFGIDFPGHPQITPRLLTVENFEGWPLRKDFHLTSRVVKPWPGVKEPAELDEDGNAIHRTPGLGDAPGPYDLDKALAEQAKLANPLPEPETVEGAEVEQGAAAADLAEDSGHVLTGESEQALEDVAQLRQDVEAAQAGAEAAGVADEAARKADERRKAQAEARARKAAQRAEEAAQSDGEEAQDADAQAGDAQDAGATNDPDESEDGDTERGA